MYNWGDVRFVLVCYWDKRHAVLSTNTHFRPDIFQNALLNSVKYIHISLLRPKTVRKSRFCVVEENITR